MHDVLIQAVFYVFAALAVVSALMAITQNNPVRCVLFLVLTFFAMSVLWMLVAAEFLALILVLVYVGAVMTLFLFVVMMLDIDTESLRSHFARYLPFGLILVALLTGLLLVSLPEGWYKTGTQKIQTADKQLFDVNDIVEAADQASKLSNTEEIGMVLYTDYVFALELAAVLLLVAIIAAITLAHRAASGSRRQDILKQIMTRADERVVLVSMKSEK